jgi:glycosyltransferase involved in cell wall biosynthesis
VTGYLVPLEAPEKCAERICELLADEALRRQMGEAGYLRAQQTFSLDGLARSLDHIYRQLLQRC